MATLGGRGGGQKERVWQCQIVLISKDDTMCTYVRRITAVVVAQAVLKRHLSFAHSF